MCDTTEPNFVSMGLDPCILQAISDLNWTVPTEVQASVIPLALEGKNVIGRARTGSGKTAAFVIPLIHNILQMKQNAAIQQTSAIILAPSRELCTQAERNVKELSAHCGRDVRCLDVTHHKNPEVYRPLLSEAPDIVIGTPARVLAHLKANHFSVKESLRTLVVDEADLVFGFGYEADTRELRQFFPAAYQALLMSATLMDVKNLRKALLGVAQWMSVDLPDEPLLPTGNQLTQYIVNAEEEDKFVLLCVLLKLRLIRGKTIVFINSTNRSYRVKLFLEQFGIPAVVLNAELPVASRLHVVNQFNSGVFNILLATDNKTLTVESEKKKSSGRAKQSSQVGDTDREYGVSRGVDFRCVSNILNFDFPTTPEDYVHRVGRTARCDQKGTALALVCEAEKPLVAKVQALLSQHTGDVFKPFNFKMDEVEAFRYRSRDALRKVTSTAIREARVREIKAELVNSTKLKGYFEDHALDLKALKHEKQLLPNQSSDPSLKNVPEYIIPKTLRRMMGFEVHGTRSRQRRRAAQNQGANDRKRKFGKRRQTRAPKRAADPLFKFEAAVQGKKKKMKK